MLYSRQTSKGTRLAVGPKTAERAWGLCLLERLEAYPRLTSVGLDPGQECADDLVSADAARHLEQAAS